jgi:DNA-binding transcriptional regulator YdaS (Cro superfamily)
MTNPRNQSTARAVWALLRRQSSEKLARRLGVSQSLLWKWSEGKATVPAWAVPAVYEATTDLDWLRDALEADELELLIMKAPPRAPASGTSLEAALHVGIEAGHIQALVSRAEADGDVSRDELRELEVAIMEAEVRLERLRAVLRSRSHAA